MSFHFRCPVCNAKLEAEDDWQGLETQCPNCQQNLQIPSATSQNSLSPESNSSSEPQALFSHFHSTRKKIALWSSCILLFAIAIAGIGYYIWSINEKRIAEDNRGKRESISRSQLTLMSKEKRHSLSANVPMFPEVEEFPFALGSSLAQCTRSYPELHHMLTQNGTLFYQDKQGRYFCFKNDKLSLVYKPDADKISALNFGKNVKNKWGEPDSNEATELFGILRWDFQNMVITIKPAQDDKYEILIHTGN